MGTLLFKRTLCIIEQTAFPQFIIYENPIVIHVLGLVNQSPLMVTSDKAE